MTDPSGVSINQVDYIDVLEDELARETRARRIVTAALNQRTRTLEAYIDKFGDITDQNGAGDASAYTTAS